MIVDLIRLSALYVLIRVFIEIVMPKSKLIVNYLFITGIALTLITTIGPYLTRVLDDVHNVSVAYTETKEVANSLLGGPTDINVGYQDAWEKLSGNARFKLPLKGEITQEYVEGEHHGIDIAGRVGDSIKASRPGKVSRIGEHETYGLYVIIDHGNKWESLYAHCSKVVVVEGSMILWGDKIAEVGNSGKSNGPHLHFEIRKDDNAINPKELLK